MLFNTGVEALERFADTRFLFEFLFSVRSVDLQFPLKPHLRHPLETADQND